MLILLLKPFYRGIHFNCYLLNVHAARYVRRYLRCFVFYQLDNHMHRMQISSYMWCNRTSGYTMNTFLWNTCDREVWTFQLGLKYTTADTMVNIGMRLMERETGGRRRQRQPRCHPKNCSCKVVALRNNIKLSDIKISPNDWAYSYKRRGLRRALVDMNSLYTMYRYLTQTSVTLTYLITPSVRILHICYTLWSTQPWPPLSADCRGARGIGADMGHWIHHHHHLSPTQSTKNDIDSDCDSDNPHQTVLFKASPNCPFKDPTHF